MIGRIIIHTDDAFTDTLQDVVADIGIQAGKREIQPCARVARARREQSPLQPVGSGACLVMFFDNARYHAGIDQFDQLVFFQKI